MDQAVRNKLRNVVTQCRKALEDAAVQALQGHFGIYAARKKGEIHVEEMFRMGHLADEDRACRQDLIEHLNHIQAIGYKPREALDQLVREIAFTHLNRLCAYKMMEARGLIREAVSRGMKSQGFSFYLVDHPDDERLHSTGQQDVAYRHFLDWLGGTLSEEIGVLFNPNDPANRIYSPQRVLDEVLALINGEHLNGIWTEDETIGWVYQYFTPKELRDQARKESQAPRNSYELAFRNQFFTPRYVVEFLTDNTLGRIWYEMRKGETTLNERCRYLVRRPKEIFLEDGVEPPEEAQTTRHDLSQEALLKQPVYIPHRPKKDPREIRVLDPACGSGHFLLYCFDLLQVIYEDAYADPDLGAALKKDYSTPDDLRRAMPGLILKHNLHGIDIDLRATQIAALALWLRCQRAYQDLGLKNGERPKITRSNIVCAEPMPGEADLLKEFTATLQPKVLGQLVEVVFEKMKLAGEAGSLLKIEEEIQEAAATAKTEYQAEMQRRKDEVGYFPGMAPPREATLFDFTDMTDEAFLDRAEEEIVETLRRYAEQKANGKAFRRRLFAEDAARGFAFVDVSRRKYDVVLMNPPFGKTTRICEQYLRRSFPESWKELYACFAERAHSIFDGQGTLGAITSSLFLYSKQLRSYRLALIEDPMLEVLVDLGGGVLDAATVDTALTIQRRHSAATASFLDLTKAQDKGRELLVATQQEQPRYVVRTLSSFRLLRNWPLCYYLPPSLLRLWKSDRTFEPELAEVVAGNHTFDDERFVRLRLEVPASCLNTKWIPYEKGGSYQPFFAPTDLVVDWEDDGREMRENQATRYGTDAQVMQSVSWWRKPGLTYPRISSIGFSPKVLPAEHMFSEKGMCVFPHDMGEAAAILAVLSSTWCEEMLLAFGRHRAYENTAIANLPLFRERIQNGAARLAALAEQCVKLMSEAEAVIETSSIFQTPAVVMKVGEHQKVGGCLEEHLGVIRGALAKAYGSIDDAVSSLLFSNNEVPECVSESRIALLRRVDLLQGGKPRDDVLDILQYSLGCVVGRWDIRLATGQREPPELPDLFAPLPVCSPGMLQGSDGLPPRPEDVPPDYPVRVDWDGILVDDSEHNADIVSRVRDVLEVIWKERAEAIEKEACEILGVRELRDYFRKPGNGGFWMDHVKRYSKSHRKAPIYWYLRSAKGNYGLWLYYHRLDKDILFKALLNYMEPKIRLEEDRLNTLHARKEAAGSSGRETKQIDKEMDRQEQFVSELHDFKDKLRRAADLHLTPNLDDGVVLNIAPLWELAPWKEAQKYWEELSEGKYEWSIISKQLCEKELVRP